MRDPSARPQRLRAAAFVALGLQATAAGAQAPVHPVPTGPAPLHERLAAADHVVLATVDAVTPDRIRLRDPVAFVGGTDVPFAVKRSPSRPPPLAVGDRKLLLLRGARSPYLLVDAGAGVLEVEEPGGAAGWAAALVRLEEVRMHPEGLRGLYLQWLEGSDPVRRQEAANALVGVDAALPPLPPPRAVACARAAVGAGGTPETRRTLALLALRRDEGLEALLAELARAGDEADPALFGIGLAAAAGRSPPSLPEALLRALAHPSAMLRRSAVLLAPRVPSQAVAAEIERLAAGDPDPSVRSAAARVLAPGDPLLR